MIFLYIFIYITIVNGQPCSEVNSVDITDGKTFDGTIIKDGVTYLPKHVFEKNVSGEIMTFGCLCDIKNCFRKCCPIGSVMLARKCVLMPEADELLTEGIDLHFFNSFKKNTGLNSSLFVVFDGKPCGAIYREIEKWYIQEVRILGNMLLGNGLQF